MGEVGGAVLGCSRTQNSFRLNVYTVPIVRLTIDQLVNVTEQRHDNGPFALTSIESQSSKLLSSIKSVLSARAGSVGGANQAAPGVDYLINYLLIN